MTSPLDPEALLAERACARLSHRYALLVDRGRASEIADLFTPDGLFATPEMQLTGREEIRETLAHRQRLTRLRTVHQLSGVLVEVTGPTTARGWVTLCLYRRFADTDTGAATDTQPALLGHYEDSYVDLDGEWLIRSRHQHVSFRDPRDPGWEGPGATGKAE